MVKWKSPVPIMFGKVGAVSVSYYYGDFGLLLGRVAFLDDAVEALVPIWQITRNGFEVTFSEHTVDVIEVSSRQLVVQGFADKVQCLWYFCLNDFCSHMPLSVDRLRWTKRRARFLLQDGNYEYQEDWWRLYIGCTSASGMRPARYQ
jgi:hypothetical protein